MFCWRAFSVARRSKLYENYQTEMLIHYTWDVCLRTLLTPVSEKRSTWNFSNKLLCPQWIKQNNLWWLNLHTSLNLLLSITSFSGAMGTTVTIPPKILKVKNRCNTNGRPLDIEFSNHTIAVERNFCYYYDSGDNHHPSIVLSIWMPLSPNTDAYNFEQFDFRSL